MGIEALAAVLARVAVGILAWWAEREGIRDLERAKLALAAAELARRALDWKERHPLPPPDGDPLGGLRVRVGADRIKSVPADDPGPPEAERPA